MFRDKAFVTVWEIDKTNHKTVNMYEKYAEIEVTTSKKNAKGNYETDFSRRVRLFGKAFDKIKGLTLSAGDRLQLTETGVRNTYDREKRKEYITFYCFDFEVANLKDKKPKSVEIVDDPLAIGDLGEELPF